MATAPMDFSVSSEMEARVFQGALEEANLDLTTATILEVISNDWLFTQIKNLTIMNCSSAKEVR